MRRIVLEDYGKLVKQDHAEEIGETRRGMVKIKVKACSVCGSDIALYRGKRSLETEKYFGHEFTGVVIDAGDNANGIKEGMRVATEVYRACGRCWYCRNGLPSYCKSMNDAFLPGGFAEETMVLNTEENSFITPIPDELDDVTASLLEPTNCSYQVALKADIKPGQKVAVIGMGSMGFITSRILQEIGAGLVVGIVNKPSRLEKVRQVGFMDAIDSSEENWIDQVHEVFGPMGPDVVVELSGNLTAFQNALTIVRPGGRIVVGSVYNGYADNVELRPIMRKELTVVGAKGPYPNLNSDGSSSSLDMLMKIKDDLKKIVSVYDYEDAIQGFEDMMTSKAIKTVITF